jgi:repressor of nif and glnA expression
MTSVVGRPKDPRVRVLVIEILSGADPPMMSIPLIRKAIEERAGVNYSWNVIAGHLADLDAEGIVKKLTFARSRKHTVSYRNGKKAGTTETRVKTNAWYQLAERFKPVDGMRR